MLPAEPSAETASEEVASTEEGDAPRGSVLGLLYAGFCYAVTLASLAVFGLYLFDLWLPFGVSDEPWCSPALAVAINIGWMVLWGGQHSVMARRGWKALLTRFLPAHTERSTYCLASSVILLGMCWGFAPLPGTVWRVEQPTWAWLLMGVSALGFKLTTAASFEIDHFSLLGLRQPWRAFRGKTAPPEAFQARYLYRLVRHPIQTGLLIGLWTTPHMSATRLCLALLLSLYVFVGLFFEERDLVRQFGQQYVAYRNRVPKLLPRPFSKL